MCALAAAGVGWRLARPAEPEPAARRDPERAVQRAIAGWRATHELAGGGRLEVRLARLHEDAEQQRFDARALRERLELGPGEPFRLELAWDGRGTPAACRPTELAVRDARGAALSAFPAAPSTSGAPVDPLRALLAPGEFRAQAGQAWTMCLWGRAPEAAVELDGLGSAPLALLPDQWEQELPCDVIARVPLGAAGPAGATRAADPGGPR